MKKSIIIKVGSFFSRLINGESKAIEFMLFTIALFIGSFLLIWIGSHIFNTPLF